MHLLQNSVAFASGRVVLRQGFGDHNNPSFHDWGIGLSPLRVTLTRGIGCRHEDDKTERWVRETDWYRHVIQRMVFTGKRSSYLYYYCVDADQPAFASPAIRQIPVSQKVAKQDQAALFSAVALSCSTPVATMALSSAASWDRNPACDCGRSSLAAICWPISPIRCCARRHCAPGTS